MTHASTASHNDNDPRIERSTSKDRASFFCDKIKVGDYIIAVISTPPRRYVGKVMDLDVIGLVLEEPDGDRAMILWSVVAVVQSGEASAEAFKSLRQVAQSEDEKPRAALTAEQIAELEAKVTAAEAGA